MPEPGEPFGDGPLGLLLLAHCGGVGVVGVLMAWGNGLPLLMAAYYATGGLLLLGGAALKVLVEHSRLRPARISVLLRPGGARWSGAST